MEGYASKPRSLDIWKPEQRMQIMEIQMSGEEQISAMLNPHYIAPDSQMLIWQKQIC